MNLSKKQVVQKKTSEESQHHSGENKAEVRILGNHDRKNDGHDEANYEKTVGNELVRLLLQKHQIDEGHHYYERREKSQLFKER